MSNKWRQILGLVFIELIFFCTTPALGQTVYANLDHFPSKPMDLRKNDKYQNHSNYFENHDNPISQLMMGMDYSNGWTVSPDINVACNWYAKAASREIPLAQHYYAICISKKLISSNESSSEIFKKSIDGGHLLSSCYLADILLMDNENKKPLNEYISQCEYLAQLGSPMASFRMYKILYREDPDKTLTQKRIDFLIKAAQDEIPEAKFILGRLLVLNSKNKDEFSIGLKFLEDAASLGFVSSFDVIAELYLYFLREKNYGYSERYLLEKSYLWSSSALTMSRDLELKYAPHVRNFKKLIPEKVIEGLDALRENFLSGVDISFSALFQ